jgi:hypothetical protein
MYQDKFETEHIVQQTQAIQPTRSSTKYYSEETEQAVIDFIKINGYVCDELNVLLPLNFATGYNAWCNGRQYNFHIVDKGGRWFLEVK